MTPQYHRNAAQEPQLRSSMVIYADVLGTSVHASSHNPQLGLIAFDAALRGARDRSGVDQTEGWSNVAWFSDNVAISAPLDSEWAEASIGFMLDHAMWLQFELANRDFFLRGGMTFGMHFADSDLVFGPALVEAVKLEGTTAQPRIALSPEAAEVVDTCGSAYSDPGQNPFGVQLAVEVDKKNDMIFISYLDGCMGEADDDEDLLVMAKQHLRAVERQLNTVHPEDVREKYLWLADYHNFVIDLHLPGRRELRIDTSPTHTFLRYRPA